MAKRQGKVVYKKNVHTKSLPQRIQGQQTHAKYSKSPAEEYAH